LWERVRFLTQMIRSGFNPPDLKELEAMKVRLYLLIFKFWVMVMSLLFWYNYMQ
jgi:hypothetical protein